MRINCTTAKCRVGRGSRHKEGLREAETDGRDAYADRAAARRRLRVPLRETLGAAVEEKEKEIRRREGILEDGN